MNWVAGVLETEAVKDKHMLLELDRLVPPSLFAQGTELGMDIRMEEA